MSGHPWGGSEVLWSRAALSLSAAGHEVHAFVKDWEHTPEPIMRLAESGIFIHKKRNRKTGRMARAWGLFRSMLGMKQSPHGSMAEMLSLCPDLVCISHGAIVCGLDWMLFCKEHHIPYTSIAHANSEAWWANDEEIERISSAYLGARNCFFVSRENLRLLETQTARKFPNSRVVWNPVNVRRDVAYSWPAGEHALRLACVGRLEPSAKGQDILLRVLATEKWRQRDIRISFFGSGPNALSLKRLSVMLGVTTMVDFAGHTNDVERIWLEHHALILASRFEGLPLCLVEAMLCHRPAIVTDVAGNKEVLLDGVTGFIASAPTVLALDEALERAWSARSNLAEFGKRASEHIRAIYPEDPAGEFCRILLNNS